MKNLSWLDDVGAGFGFAVGVGMLIVLVLVGEIAFGVAFPPSFNNSDGHAQRSGLIVRTDHLTGCQFLESSKGYLTLRRDHALKPVCVAPG